MNKRDIREWNANIDRMLTNMDVRTARLVIYSAGDAPSDDEVVLIAMHKARIERTAIDPKLRLESVEWLRARGYERRGGLPLPPPGVLPE